MEKGKAEKWKKKRDKQVIESLRVLSYLYLYLVCDSNCFLCLHNDLYYKVSFDYSTEQTGLPSSAAGPPSQGRAEPRAAFQT